MYVSSLKVKDSSLIKFSPKEMYYFVFKKLCQAFYTEKKTKIKNYNIPNEICLIVTRTV